MAKITDNKLKLQAMWAAGRRKRLKNKSEPLNLTPYQCKLARAALSWTLNDLAKYSGYHRQMLYRFEASRTVNDVGDVTKRLRGLFEAAKLEFKDNALCYPAMWTYEQ